MGLLDNATQAKALHDEATKAARIAESIAAWEARLSEAKAWWTEHITEPAEFFFPAGDGAPNYVDRKGVVAVCDGWPFYIDEFDHRHRPTYNKGDGLLAAYLIVGMSYNRIDLYKPPSYHSDPPKIRSLADLGRVLEQFIADGRYEQPEADDFIWRKVTWK